MSVFKKAAAFLTALGLVGTMAGCGYNTRDALEVNGYSVPAGVYIYFANTAYNQALSQLKTENEELDTTDVKAVQAATLEGKDVRTWVEDKATEMVVDFVATEQKFDELGLTLSDEDNLNLKSMMDYYWASNKEVMEKNGIGESSFKMILTSSYKSDAVFEHYYGIGGELGVTEEDLSKYYAENNIRAQYVRFSLADSEGNTMKDAEKAEIKSMVDGYKNRVEDALASGGVDAVMKEMDTIQKEYTDFVNGAAEEAETEAAAETEAETEAAAEETAAETEAATEAAAEETEAETEAAETEAETEAAEAEVATTPVLAGDVTEAAEAETEAAAEETEAETEAAAEETEAETEAAAEETKAETEAAAEETEAETEAAEAEVEEETLTTPEMPEEEVAPYSNETIISVVHEEDYDDPSQIYYNPNEKVYTTLVGIKEADYGKPYFVEDDNTYFLVVRYDIKDRMTEDDLWTESAMNSANYAMHNKDFENLLDTWTNTMTVKRNDAAYRRYDPFKFDFT